jgi:hypothetical protein
MSPRAGVVIIKRKISSHYWEFCSGQIVKQNVETLMASYEEGNEDMEK